MRKRSILQRLEREFGTVPSTQYYAGDMENITSYFDYRRSNELDEFLLDETTWYDLELDQVFKRINPGLTTSGEQYLYYMLRHPAIHKSDFDERSKLISEMENNPPLRLKLQYILSKLGRSRNAVLCSAFNPESRGPGWMILYISLAIAFIASLIAIIFSQTAILAAVAFMTVNLIVHNHKIELSRRDFDTVNYSMTMIVTLDRIKKLKDPTIDALFSPAYESLTRFRSAMRLGGVAVYSSDALMEFVCSAFLLDLINYEFLKNKLWRNHKDIFIIHEYIGKADASIAVASYKKSIPQYCVPVLDFSGAKPAFYEALDMVHPIISKPVPNDLISASPVLLTGSNASGKSTYLKTAAICAIMAQSICVCTAKSYRSSAFRIYSSMALKDDLALGESYYIIEIKSLKRIVDAAQADSSILCVIDEVLRGTNTVERISASTEVLRSLQERGVLCLAATHDIELCALLAGRYTLSHFEETIDDNEMVFDYKVKKGPAGTRNAIKLLKLMGFDDDIVDRAHQRADQYMKDGVWHTNVQ